MKAVAREAILAVMSDYPNGVDAPTLSERIGKTRQTIRQSLERIPHAYIDRWDVPPKGRGPRVAVWKLVPVPPNCPSPRKPRAKVEKKPAVQCKPNQYGIETVWRVAA